MNNGSGGFVAALCTIGANRSPLDLIALKLKAAGMEAQIFSASGPAGVVALFPAQGRTYGEMFFNEFLAALVIAMVIWACLDSQNIFLSPVIAPYTIGLVCESVQKRPSVALAALTLYSHRYRRRCHLGLHYGRRRPQHRP